MASAIRQDLLDKATDHVLSEGLIGLSLRPLAAAIGTSDRMLIYHFGSRDNLISAILVHSSTRSRDAIDALAKTRSVRSGVNRLWEAYRAEPLNSCLDVYCQAAATGLIGQEPYLSEVRAINLEWHQALCRYLLRCGAGQRRVERVATLIDSSLFGFHLDLTTDRPQDLARAVDDLAVAAEALSTR